MLHWRLIYYLLQFFLFAVSGALSYLSLRAWLDPSLSRRKREDPHRVPRWSHLVRGAALLCVASAAIIGAVNERAVGIGFTGFALLRLAGYVIFLVSLPRSLWRERSIWVGSALIAIAEFLFIFQLPKLDSHAALAVSYGALVLTGFGLGIVGLRMVHAVLRLRLVDRLVISFAVYGLLLAQMVAFIELEVLSSFLVNINVGISPAEALAERPLLMILSSVLILSALIGFFLARDLSLPVTRLGQALRAIGDGNFDRKVEVVRGRDDEMNDLAVEVNRMSSQLKAADELRSDFLSFVSHELRSPLTSIKGFITTLGSVDDFSPSERAEMYGIVDSETDRLLRMINELLDLSRVQAGKPLKLTCEWFDVGAHLSKMAGVVAADAPRHRIEVVVPEIPVWVCADRDKVTQILLNLMSNAIKYSPGGGNVTVRLEDDEAGIALSVSDQGVGMTSDQAEHVFDKFYRVAEQSGTDGAKRLRRVEGAGIGLYLTRALVEAHGGAITVLSEPGVGSVFTVRLPKEPDDLENSDESEGEAATRGGNRDRAALLSPADRIHVPHLIKPKGEPDRSADQPSTVGTTR